MKCLKFLSIASCTDSEVIDFTALIPEAVRRLAASLPVALLTPIAGFDPYLSFIEGTYTLSPLADGKASTRTPVPTEQYRKATHVTHVPLPNSVKRSEPPFRTGISRYLPLSAHLSSPALVRTSTLLQPPLSPNPKMKPPYDPKSLYPLRVFLEIDGDLDSMPRDWTINEMENNRRLVLFTRTQSGSTITTKFETVDSDRKLQNGCVISCMRWPEKNDYFVTGIEIIALLEILVADRFTVEEKNRIRRNLEGYKSLTVSKDNADSGSFFKIMMDFPLPKLRNFEKDVKIFYWKDLTVALMKLISEYVSACFAFANTKLTCSSL